MGEGTGVRRWDDHRQRRENEGSKTQQSHQAWQHHLREVFKFCKTLLPDLLESFFPPLKIVLTDQNRRL